MTKLPIGLGILSWKSDKSIRNTLRSLHRNGLLDICNSTTIFFQEVQDKDLVLARQYNLEAMTSKLNIGIGGAFLKLAKHIKDPYVILLEHDWELVESPQKTFDHLAKSLELLRDGFSCVRLRHRYQYGHPHYSFDKYRENELNYYDDWMELYHPHLIDTLHWIERPDLKWPDKILKIDDFFSSSSRYANWTNNPCLYERKFFNDSIENFIGDGIDLERNISYWWARQNYKVAQGNGLFKHNDKDKYDIFSKIKRNLRLF